MKFFKNLSYYIIPLLVAFFNILIIIAPNLVITSAQNGLMLWFNKVLPSIFPFLIGTNLLINLGFIDFLGTLLEPFMKKFFNVSGCGAFALVLGMFSGYPVGAKITSSLREAKKISKVEAQRLVSFTNNSGPLFIIGTVGIGMFKNIKIGYLILAIHYLAAITVGFLFRFYKKNEKLPASKTNISLKDAFFNLKLARLKNKKTFGEILGSSVKNSLETIAMIGGFIILFSVVSELLNASQIFDKIGSLILPESLRNFSNGIFMGIIEVTNGINNLSANITKEAIIICCGLVSFSGLSIIAQTASMLTGSDIKMSLYIFSKFLHSIISIFYALILIPVINLFLKDTTVETFSSIERIPLKSSFISFALSIFILVLISFIYFIFLNYNKKNKIKF